MSRQSPECPECGCEEFAQYVRRGFRVVGLLNDSLEQTSVVVDVLSTADIDYERSVHCCGCGLELDLDGGWR